MRLTMKANDLHRLLYNAKIFQVGSGAKPVTLEFGSSFVVASIDDNHTYVQDLANVTFLKEEQPINRTWLDLPVPTVKSLELILRDVSDKIEVQTTATNIRIDADQASYDVEPSDGPHLKYVLDGTQYLLKAEGKPYALLGNRFRKLGLLKPEDYPYDFRRVEHDKYGELILFKYGPTCRGALVTMDREILAERDDAADILW